jgi:glycerol kinase
MNTGEKAVSSKNGLVTTIAATSENEKIQYALEGTVFIGGAVIQWLRDELGLIKTAPESEEKAKKVPSSEGVYIVPAFAGLGAPYWDMYVKGTVFGLTRGSNENHIIRAALESIAYQTNDLIAAMSADSGITIETLKADGGASKNNLLMQFQANISDIAVCVPENAEATALGVSLLAGLTCGLIKDKEEILSIPETSKTFLPLLESTERTHLISGWKKAIRATKEFSKGE